MKFLPVLIAFCIHSLFISVSLAQQSKVDSLMNLLQQSKPDTNRVNLLNALAWQYYDKDSDQIKLFAEQALQLSQQLNYTYGIARSNNNLGSYYYFKSLNQEALLCYQKALHHYELLNNAQGTKGIIMSTSNIGRTLKAVGKYPEALAYMFKSLQAAQQANELIMAANILNSIGDLMEKQERYKEALSYYFQALAKAQSVKNKKEETIATNNIGNAYLLLKQYDQSVTHLKQSLEMAVSENIPRYEVFAYNNLGMAYLSLNQTDSALYYFQKGLFISEKHDFTNSIIKASYGMAKINLLKGKPREAMVFFNKGLFLAGTHGLVNEKLVAYEGLTEVYKSQKNFQEALQQQTRLLALRDSLMNEENSKKIDQLQTNYEIDKKQAEIELLKKDGELLKKDTERAMLLRNAVAAGLLAMLIIAGLIVSRQRLKIRQNRLLLEKSEEVRSKNSILEQQARTLEQQAVELARQTEKLQELDQVKSTFFANLSHEFRTPLTLILSGLGDKLREYKESGKLTIHQNEVTLMHRNARRLLQLINQLLDLSKIESGKMHIEPSKGDLAHFFRVLAGSFSSLVQQRRIQLDLQLPPQPLPALFDEDKLEKIFSNLLSNACKFTPDGGKIGLHVQVVEQTTHVPHLQISVEDTGPGIRREELDKVFHRFYQSTTYYSDVQGTGIGLALTKELVELHGGSIHVESEPGKGARFMVILPYVPVTEDQIPAIPASATYSLLQAETPVTNYITNNTPLPEHADAMDASSAEKASGAAKEQAFPLVLVVEDNEDLRTYIRHKLSSTYRIIESENGLKGLEKALAAIPDLIISDWMMPDMDGLQLCTKLKADERTNHIPVILLTALTTTENKLYGLEKGADEYLTKPFDARELEIRVKNLIENRRKLRDRYSKKMLLQPKDIEVTSTDEKFLKRAMQIVEERMGDSEFGTEEFSREIGMSRMQLHRKLTALTGQSTTDFIRTLRLKRAVQLMEGQTGNITQIAYDVGFSNLSYFAKCFREQYGMSPLEYMTTYQPAS